MRRSVQRGIVALTIAGSLSIAGPRPAAAMDLGLMHQISRIWSFFAGAPSPAPHRTTAGKPVTGKSTSSQQSPDAAWGVDPNGSLLTPDPVTLPHGG